MTDHADDSPVKETVRLPASQSSWRGTYEDLRGDVEAAELLVRRRAGAEKTHTVYSVDLDTSLGEGRTRDYADLDGLIEGVTELGTDVVKIEVLLTNPVISFALTMDRKKGVDFTVRGSAVGAEGVRREAKRQFARHESLPSGVLHLVDGAAVVVGFFAFYTGLERIWGFHPSSFVHTAFPVGVGVLILLGLLRVALTRTFPRLELVVDSARSSTATRRLATAAGYLATAVLGGLADHIFR